LAKQNESDQVTAAGGGSMDQVREILFGQFERENAASLQKLEALIEKYSKNTTEELADARAQLQKDLAKTAADLAARLDQQGQDLASSRAELERALQDMSKALTEKIAETASHADKELNETRSRLQKNVDALGGNLERSVAQLDDAKADRADLGDMLIELGLRLKGDATLEAIKSQVNKAQSSSTVKRK
jgi:ElaB/YqjD/DUF883 family membrane-anchored ribosome-binding protein